MVNGVRASEPAVLRPGDRIRLGEVELVVGLGPGAEISAAAPTTELAQAPVSTARVDAHARARTPGPRVDAQVSAPILVREPRNGSARAPNAAAPFDVESQRGEAISNIAGNPISNIAGNQYYSSVPEASTTSRRCVYSSRCISGRGG